MKICINGQLLNMLRDKYLIYIDYYNRQTCVFYYTLIYLVERPVHQNIFGFFELRNRIASFGLFSGLITSRQLAQRLTP